MKKSLVLILLFVLVLSVSLFATGTSRVYSQNVVCTGGTGIIDNYITNASTSTSTNYIATATISSDPGVTVTSGIAPLGTIRVNRLTASLHYVVINVANISPTVPYATGDIVHVTMTWNGGGAFVGQSTSWDFPLPAGTGVITVNSPTQNVPPIAAVAGPDPTLATVPVPSIGAINVPLTTTQVSWTYVHDALFTDPVGYKVYFGAGVLPSTFTYVPGGVGTFNMPVTLASGLVYHWKVVPTTVPAGKGPIPGSSRQATLTRGDAVGAVEWTFTAETVVTGFDALITSNILGVDILQDGSDTGFNTPHTFTLPQGSYNFSVMEIATQVTPPPQAVSAGGTYTFNYTNPANTTGGGAGGSIVASTGAVSVPTTGGVTVTGTVEAPGVLVVTHVTPAAKGTYHGYLNVSNVYQVWASDVTMLNGGALSFSYGDPLPKFVAIHWGGANNGYYPVNHPETVGIATPGYAFNGGVSHGGYNLGMAPFTGSNYTGGILNILAIPPYQAKGAGTFEIILSQGDVDLPVELSSFNAVATAQMFVNLQWTTESETNNLGFNVYRSSTSNVSEASLVNFGIIGGTNTTTTHNYNFVDSSVDPETTYYYWLQMVNFDGTSSFSSSVMVTTNGQPPVQTVPEATALNSAYPNPFSANTSTNIKVDVKRNETATLTIYNVLGQSVKTYSLHQGSTLVNWNGRDDNGAVCGSGIYFYKLSSPSVNTTKKMVIVK